jgi:hypothetical protein
MTDLDLPSAVRLLCAFAQGGQPIGSPMPGASAYERQVETDADDDVPGIVVTYCPAEPGCPEELRVANVYEPLAIVQISGAKPSLVDGDRRAVLAAARAVAEQDPALAAAYRS